jgi:hypothetical protein
MQHAAPSGLLLIEIEIIAYLKTKNRQNTGTQGPRNALSMCCKTKQETEEGLGVDVQTV